MPWSKDNLPKNVEGMNLSEHQIEVFVKAANAALKEYGDEVKAIKVGIAAAEHQNENKIKGGLADNMSLEDIAKKHNVDLSEVEKALDKGIKVESEHTSDKEEAKEIAMDHLVEDIKYYDKLEQMENTTQEEKETYKIKTKMPEDIDYKFKQIEKDIRSKKLADKNRNPKTNSLDKRGEIRYIRHCKSGIATYPNETILIQDECLKNMMPSMAGIPIYISHVNEVDMQSADGYVTECFYNMLDGCYWAKVIIVDFEALQKITAGYGASNAYLPLKIGDGGLYHGGKYDREVIEAEYTHLAIVPNPRYNESLILTPIEYKNYNDKLKEELKELHNSLDVKKEPEKQKGEQKMAEKENKSILKRIGELFMNAAEEDKEKEKEEPEMDEKDKKIKDLEEKLNALMKKNEEEEEKKKEEEEKKNKAEEEEKKNAQYFNALEEASKKRPDDPSDKIKVVTRAEMLEAGKKHFS